MLGDAAAFRASHFLAVAPARMAEVVEGRIVRQGEDLPKRHRAGLGGQEEVLRHDGYLRSVNLCACFIHYLMYERAI